MRIRLRNWYSWAAETLEVSACHFLVGINGIGKTSAIRDALEFAYLGTGELRGFNSKKDMAAEVIRDDGVTVEGCEVTVELAGKRVRRTMDHDGNQRAFLSLWHGMTGQSGEWSDEEELALKRDQGSPWGDEPDDLVRCLLEPTHFSTLSGSRRQEVLIRSTSDASSERQAVLDALNAKLSPDADDDVKAIESAATWVVDSGFRGAEDAAIEQRKEAKRDAKVVVVGDEPGTELTMEDERVLDLSKNTLEQHQHHLAKLRTDHTAAVRTESAGAGAIVGKLAEAEQAFATMERKGEPQPAAPRGNRLGALGPEPEDEAPLAVRVQAADLAARLLGDILRLEREELATARGAAEQARTSVSEASAFPRPDTCPIGPPGMRCAAKPSQWNIQVERAVGDQDAITRQIEELTDHLARKVTSVEECTDKLEVEKAAAKALHDEADALTLQWTQWRSHAVGLTGQDDGDARARVALQKARDEWLLAFEKSGERVETLRRDLAKAQAGEKAEGPTSEELAGRIKVGEHVVEKSKDYWREREGWLDRSQRRADLDDTVKRWDAICQQLKPEGIETTLGGHAREAFVRSLEDVAGLAGRVLLSETCALSVQPYADDLPARTLTQLSESQRLALGVSIQHALCQLASFPVLIVDRIDVFDKAHRSAWAAMAQSMSERGCYEAIVGLATIQRDPKPPGAPWKTSWMKPDGTVQLLGGDF